MISIRGSVLVLSILCASALGQPRLIAPEPGCYLPGDRVDPAVYVYDFEGRRVALTELFGAGSKAIVLSLLGGAAEGPSDGTRRGNLWCKDTFDDMAVQRALSAYFRGQPVRFIAIAIPDVLSPGAGGTDNLFLSASRDDEAFNEKFSRFIANTEKERIATVLPFTEIFYDPRGRLILGEEALGEVSPGYGQIYDWQGKFKWHLDSRTYGLPAIWVLKGDGTVACEPFWGNDYDSSPPQINYGFEELKAEVEKLLK